MCEEPSKDNHLSTLNLPLQFPCFIVFQHSWPLCFTYLSLSADVKLCSFIQLGLKLCLLMMWTVPTASLWFTASPETREWQISQRIHIIFEWKSQNKSLSQQGLWEVSPYVSSMVCVGDDSHIWLDPGQSHSSVKALDTWFEAGQS